jgi:hypothetical protein
VQEVLVLLLSPLQVGEDVLVVGLDLQLVDLQTLDLGADDAAQLLGVEGVANGGGGGVAWRRGVLLAGVDV